MRGTALGDGYEATNDIQDARMAYARSVELNPNNEHAKGELVKLPQIAWRARRLQPLFHLQRFNAERDSVPPAWQQPIAEHSLVSSDCRVCLRMDGFGGFDELMFRVVMCQIRKCYTSAEIHLVDVQVLPFDLRPYAALVGEIFYKTNRNFVLDSLTVGLSSCTKEQDPSFSSTTFLFFLTNLVDVCVSLRSLLRASQMPE